MSSHECGSCDCKKKKGMGSFLCGAAIGGALAMLFSPNNGEENRRLLKKKFDEFALYVKNFDKDEVVSEINKKIDDIKKDLEALDKETVLKLAKEQGKKIQDKAVELFEYSKEKATPVVQNITEEIKEKTVLVAKDVINKLEKEEKKTSKK